MGNSNSGCRGLSQDRIDAIYLEQAAGSSAWQAAKKLGHKYGTIKKYYELGDPGPKYDRCPGCGGLVELPCVTCRIRRFQQFAQQRITDLGKTLPENDSA